MSDEQLEQIQLTAAEARSHLAELRNERALALANGAASVRAYLADLDDEIEMWRRLYVVAAVTDIASLRGVLFGVNAE